jgi:hypothetical protein
LGGGRGRCGEGGGGKGRGNEELTHLALSFEKRLMRESWNLPGEAVLNATVICRSPTLIVQVVGKAQFLILQPRFSAT